MSVVHRGLVSCLIGAALAAAGCAADPSYPPCGGKPAAEDVQAAKGAHAAAVRLFERHDFERAIALWQLAYELDCSAHGLLINIARAHEKLGDDDAADRVYRLYLARAGREADPAIVAKFGTAAPPPASTAPPERARPAADQRAAVTEGDGGS